MSSGIYKIQNKVNNKIYIGRTSRDINSRFKEHKYQLNRNTHINDHLQNSWNKYGQSNFKFEVILYCEDDDLRYYEGELIEKYESYKREKGYNFMKDGLERSIPAELKNKLSKRMKEWHRNNIHPCKNKPHSDEVISKIRNSQPNRCGDNNPMYGQKHSEETKKRIGKSNQGNDHGKSKLCRQQVKEIKRRLEDGETQSSIAKDFPVNYGAIGCISREETWCHVTI